MSFIYGVITATLAIVFSEILFNYGLGDFLKDFFVGMFVKGKTFTTARLARLEAKAAKIRAAL